MRWIIVLAGLVTWSAEARAESLWEAEVRAGYGVAISGGQGMETARRSPLTLAATGAMAINDEPLLYGFGGFMIETIDRNTIGAFGGLRLQSVTSPLRLAGGAAYVFAPKTLWGAFVSGGGCHRTSPTMKVCGDLQVTTYFEGTDLPTGHMVTEGQLVLGIVFDAP